MQNGTVRLSTYVYSIHRSETGSMDPQNRRHAPRNLQLASPPVVLLYSTSGTVVLPCLHNFYEQNSYPFSKNLE